MTGRRRLGVALLIEPPHAQQIDGLRRAVRDPALERVPPHLTLVSPVNVRAADLPAGLAVVRTAAGRCGRPLRLTLGPPATFLPANPVLYLGVGGDLPELGRLHDDVFQPPLERRLGWPWVPHVTLAESLDPDRISAAVSLLDGYQVVVDVHRVVLLEEIRPRWVPLADACLRSPVVIGRGGLAVELVEGRVLGPDGHALLASAVGAPVEIPAGSLVLSAVVAGVLAGVGLAWRDDGGGHVTVVVDPAHRRAGIGRQVLAHTEDAVRRAGWTSPVLDAVGPDGFYAACSDWSRVSRPDQA